MNDHDIILLIDALASMVSAIARLIAALRRSR